MIHGAPLLVVGAIEYRLVLGMIALGVWLIRQVFAAVKKETPQPRRPAGRPAPAGAPRPTKAQPPGNVKPTKEIEEFLKRTAQRRGAKKTGESAVPPQVRKPPRRLSESLPTLAAASAVAAPTGASVAEHVEKHLATDEFTTRAAHLADDVVRSEQDMQQHLQKAFSHQVGRLADTSRQAAEDKQEAAAATAKAAAIPRGIDLAALLADGTRLRQAIVVNEILQRPEHRW